MIGRFWSKVRRSGLEECWEWQAARNRSIRGKPTYGIYWYQGLNIGAHRMSYIMTHGAIPKGKLVLHHCDNMICVNPKHLYAGTHAENTRDAKERNRLATGDANGSRLHPESRPRGMNHVLHAHPERACRGERKPQAIVNESQVRAIRQLAVTTDLTHRQIGQRYGLSRGGVLNIVNRRKWKHVD